MNARITPTVKRLHSPAAAAMLGLGALLVITLLLTNTAAGATQGTITVRDARIEQGSTWPAASPITISVRFDGSVALAQWQWVSADGRTIQWEGEILPPRDLRPSGDTWISGGAVPPIPGAYAIRLLVRAPGTTQDRVLTTSLRGTATPSEKLTRGIAFVRDRNIWLQSLDGKQARALTFYGGTDSASMPAWSPDGRRIAYIRDIGKIGSGPDLWLMYPDGTGTRRVSEHAAGRSLAYPLYGPDGALYVTESRVLRAGGVELGETSDLMRVDLANGRRTPVLPGVSEPDISSDGRRIVYVQQELSSDATILRSIMAVDIDGRNERVLVPAKEGQGVASPAWSPDGRLVAFAGENVGGSPPQGLHQGMRALAFHGGTWDLWTVPADGSAPPKLLFAVQEEGPFPRWHPDGGSLLYTDPVGLFTVPAAGGPPVLVAESDTFGEISIFAPAPRPAPKLAGRETCFRETGHCLRGVFLTYWESKGGLAQFGFPITDELIEEGRTVQYTQRARLEWHRQHAGTPNEVLLGRLGADMADARASAREAPFGRVARPAGSAILYFPETGHTLQAPLRAYWERHGGLPVFGYPMSEAFRERSPTDGKEYLVQYFERNRLEYHPEFANSPNEVLLGLLGVQEHTRRYGR